MRWIRPRKKVRRWWAKVSWYRFQPVLLKIELDSPLLPIAELFQKFGDG